METRTARPAPIVDATAGSCETLIGLVERYSPTGAEGDAVAWLVERMRRLGAAQAFVDDAGNAVGVWGGGPRQGILLGHIDTVPGRIPVRLEGGLLHGRGAVDAKGPLAAFVDAAAAAGDIPGWQWVVVGAVDEEGESRGARALLDHEAPGFVIVGEPSRWDRVTIGYKGSAWTRVTVRRSMVHSAAPGQTAAEAAVELWQSLRAWAAAFNDGRPRPFDQVTSSLRGWESGDDGFEAWATLHLGTRLPLAMSPESWLARLRSIAPQAEVEFDGFPTPAYRGDKNSILSRAFLAAIRASGGTPNFVVKTGTADLNLVAPRWGCPGLAYGPGDSALDHTPDEHISLEEFARSRRIVADVLRRVGGRADGDGAAS
ncbi:MAG TPA: [LysW]-lysine hydrolase [Anaerolineales bacterium]|nr:[LysW]-lysine hydrolase [Anaerolineales bacterium]